MRSRRLLSGTQPPWLSGRPSRTRSQCLAFTRKSSPSARPSAQLSHPDHGPDGLTPLLFITQRAFCTPPCNGWLISRPCPLGYVPCSSACIGARAPSSGLQSFSCWRRRLTPGGGCGGPSSRSPGWLQRGDGAHCRRSSSCRAHARSYRHPPAGRGRQGHATDMCCRARRPPAAGPRRARGPRAAGDRGMCAGGRAGERWRRRRRRAAVGRWMSGHLAQCGVLGGPGGRPWRGPSARGGMKIRDCLILYPGCLSTVVWCTAWMHRLARLNISR